MENLECELQELLTKLDDQNKILTTMAKDNMLIGQGFYIFDVYITGLINRTVNVVKGFTNLMRDKNFIAAAPLVRIHLDSLLRFYAPQLIGRNVDDFAMEVYQGIPVRKIKDKYNKPLTDAYLVERLNAEPAFTWVKQVYETGNGFIHFSDQTIFASMQVSNLEDRIVQFTVGQHDEFIPLAEKHGAGYWMNKITEGIIVLLDSWMHQKKSYMVD